MEKNIIYIIFWVLAWRWALMEKTRLDWIIGPIGQMN